MKLSLTGPQLEKGWRPPLHTSLLFPSLRPPWPVRHLTSVLTRMVVTMRVLLASESVTLLFFSRLVSVRFMPLYEFHTAIWKAPRRKRKEKVGAFRFTATPPADTYTWDHWSEHKGTELDPPTIQFLQP